MAEPLNPVVAKSLDRYACDEAATAYAADPSGYDASYVLRGLDWVDDLPERRQSALVKAINAELRDAREWAFRAGWEAARDESNRR